MSRPAAGTAGAATPGPGTGPGDGPGAGWGAGRGDPPPVLTALYVPGDRPDRFDRAVAARPDVLIVDLEDAVAADRKDQARREVLAWLATGRAPVAVQVRVNPAGTPWAAADLAALASLPLEVAVRLPKTEHPDQVRAVRAAAGPRAVHPIVESAAGVLALESLARADGVATLALGEADLAGELGTSGEEALTWVRSRLVVAAAAAGLPPPLMSVYPAVQDSAGLAGSCRLGRRLGLLGRAAVHPRQLPVIVDAFLPTDAEVAHAAEVVRLLGASATGPPAAGPGVTVDSAGVMVDAAMLRRARRILLLAQRRT